MRTIDLNEAKHCLPPWCDAVARTGETVIMLADQKPLVTLVVGRINFDRCSSVIYVGRRRNTYGP